MAYIQFLSEKLNSKKQIYLDILLSAYNIKDIESVLCRNSKTFNITKFYVSDNGIVEENINFLEQDVDTYNEYLKYPDEENPCIVLNAIKNKRLISLFSADKVRCKRLLFEFGLEYLKLYPYNYLLIDEKDLYDLEGLKKKLEELNIYK
ncbi:hypothetical protein [uncultured Flavobacterium sp.]|uniref:hypothetical protein n=1 Tax=uncultured Flavobacterium sp. TaxID=165435 RepID=UPI0025EC57D2|nr:hypothetical protein [uncultured Flavobacterium sp.]